MIAVMEHRHRDESSDAVLLRTAISIVSMAAAIRSHAGIDRSKQEFNLRR